eukprot:7993752-Pyramimonas_sp.AAC.2
MVCELRRKQLNSPEVERLNKGSMSARRNRPRIIGGRVEFSSGRAAYQGLYLRTRVDRIIGGRIERFSSGRAAY